VIKKNFAGNIKGKSQWKERLL